MRETDSKQFFNKCQNDWNCWLDIYIERIKYEIKDIKDDQQLLKYDSDRKTLMNSINPRYILRNYLAENAIKQAENGDFTEAKRLLKVLEDPFCDKKEFNLYRKKPSASSCMIGISCS